MRRIIVHDEINTAYGNRTNELSKDIFQRNLSYFKLINGWLNSRLCAKRKSLHSDENAYVFFVKKETCDRAMKLDALGNFVPLYFSLNLNFLLPLFPGAIVELENSVFE